MRSIAWVNLEAMLFLINRINDTKLVKSDLYFSNKANLRIVLARIFHILKIKAKDLP